MTLPGLKVAEEEKSRDRRCRKDDGGRPYRDRPAHGRALMNDEHFLRRSFEVARRSMTHGNHPFGAILVDDGGRVLLEAENGYMPARDGTAHAERLLATEACRTLSEDARAT